MASERESEIRDVRYTDRLLRGSHLTCPDLETCRVPITKHFFEWFCHNEKGKGDHEACNYYCGRHDMLKPPMQWLQHLAVAAELKPPGRWMYEHRPSARRR